MGIWMSHHYISGGRIAGWFGDGPFDSGTVSFRHPYGMDVWAVAEESDVGILHAISASLRVDEDSINSLLLIHR